MSRMIFLDEQTVLERFIANKLASITLIDKVFLRNLNHPLFSIIWMLIFTLLFWTIVSGKVEQTRAFDTHASKYFARRLENFVNKIPKG